MLIPDQIAQEMRLDAKAFRENTVYDSGGDPIRLTANAERMEAAADLIAYLVRKLRLISDQYENQDLSHVAFRVCARHLAGEALAYRPEPQP